MKDSWSLVASPAGTGIVKYLKSECSTRICCFLKGITPSLHCWITYCQITYLIMYPTPAHY